MNRGTVPDSRRSAGIGAYSFIEAGFDVNYADKQGTTP
jgi:hypothetical protein